MPKKAITILSSAAVALAALALLNTAATLTGAAPKGGDAEPNYLVVTPLLSETVGTECNTPQGVYGNLVRYDAVIDTAGWGKAYAYWIEVDATGAATPFDRRVPKNLSYRNAPDHPTFVLSREAYYFADIFSVIGTEGTTSANLCSATGSTVELKVYLTK